MYRFWTIFFLFVTITAFAQDPFDIPLVYQEPSMSLIKSRSVIYQDTLKADLYLPEGYYSDTSKYSIVIFVSGSAGINLRKMRSVQDWARLMAVNNILGIVYETNDPVQNFDSLVNFLFTKADTFKINKNRIGLWSGSANTLLALHKVNINDLFRCHVIYYGLTSTYNSKYSGEVKQMASKYEFPYPVSREYDSRTPTFIVRTGKDNWTVILNSIDEFSQLLLSNNIPFTLINYPDGIHAFDAYDHSITSEKIILQSLDFIKEHLE